MSTPSVSIHPYFKVHPGKMDSAKALLPLFVARTKSEPACLQYEFTVSDDVVFCREAYADAAGALAHLENVDSLLKEMLQNSDLLRLEFHGPSAELDKLKGPLAALQPTWFAFDCGK
jgi:quinol monooxygenase YgiN